MLGVVLWSDKDEENAVVWCEDHGDLAFIGRYSHATTCVEKFGEGDLIQFDLAQHQNMRLAKNPKRIASYHCSTLKDVIRKASAMGVDGPGARALEDSLCGAGPDVFDTPARSGSDDQTKVP